MGNIQVLIPRDGSDHGDAIRAKERIIAQLGDVPDHAKHPEEGWEWHLEGENIRIIGWTKDRVPRTPTWFTSNVSADLGCSDCDWRFNTSQQALSAFDNHNCKEVIADGKGHS